MATRALGGSVRIVGGVWRGKKIPISVRATMRPSGDRVREALFNCLGQRLDGLSCLDLFAGSGALGLEAASRGAKRVILVDKDKKAAAAIRMIATELGAPAIIFAGSAERFLDANRRRFDLIFLDPPFADYSDDGAWERLLGILAPRLSAGGQVYCESDRRILPPEGWRQTVARRAGGVYWRILDRKE